MAKSPAIAATLAAALAAGSAMAQAPTLRGPVPAAPIQNWISANDFPAAVLKSVTAIGPADFALTISDKGRVTRCTVERSSGSKPLDDVACYIFQQRGRFQPAADAQGKPAIGVYRVDAQWAVAGQSAAPHIPLAEMAVALEKMPKPLSDPAYVDIAVSVDETGKVDGCAPTERLSWAGQPIVERQQAAQVLSGVPCAQALKGLKLEPAKTEKGVPVRSVQIAAILFTADVPALVASVTPKRDAPAGAAPAAATAPELPSSPDTILVEGRNIKGTITRPEASVPAKGFNPFVDFEAVGYEVVLLKAQGGQWYRATLDPPCIGNSNFVVTDMRDPPGIAVSQNPDGSVDYRSTVYVHGAGLPATDNGGDGKCHMSSLVESAPPKGFKASTRTPKPQPPILAARAPIKAPDGGQIYPVQWEMRPTPAQFAKIAAGWSGSGWILCQTASENKVRNCRTASESPPLTGVANRMKLESGNFRVRPPTVDGRPAIGAWVAIGFDFTAKRKEPVPCNPSDPRDPC